MSEMIERVAKAILDEQRKNRSAFPDNRDLARAAIEAMREPAEGMVDAGVAAWGSPSSVDVYENIVAEYRCMIDAALGKDRK